MFGMLPFERGNDNTFDTFDKFMRNFFDHSNTSPLSAPISAMRAINLF